MNLFNKNKTSSTIILPTCKPVITSYTRHAHILSIIGNYKEAYPWIFSNYIEIFMNKDYLDFYFPLPYELGFADICKWIQEQKIDKKHIESKWNSVIDFVIDYINYNNYVHTMIDYFYIPFSECYNKYHFSHDIIIYGYNLDKSILYISDFFNNGKYTNKEISFLHFSKAFCKCDFDNDIDYLHGMVRLYSFDNSFNYKFDIRNIENSLRAYLLGSTPEYWNLYNNSDLENAIFGIHIYESLKQELLKGEKHIDIRLFYVFYDHKKIMNLRFKYLYDQGYLKNDNNIIVFNEIETKANIIVSLVIKYYITKDTNIINRIINLLDEIQVKEFNILKQYISI